MAFSFNYPLVLLLIPVAAVFVLLTSRKMLRIPGWKKKTIAVLRLAVLVLVILSISGLGIKKVSDEATTIFVVDASESVQKKQGEIEDFVKKALAKARDNDKAGIIRFGQDAQVEAIPRFNPVFTAFQTKINSRFTNIEQALNFAATLIPGEDRKRIVLATDGRENAGDVLKQARILKQQGIALDIYPIVPATGAEVQLKSIKIPESMRLDERFEIEVNIDSTVNTSGKLKLFSDGTLVAEKTVEISQGLNRFVFSDTARTGGVNVYSATIEPDIDTVTKNNSMAAFSYVEDKANILVVQGEDRAAEELVRMLGDNANIRMVMPGNAPSTLYEMLKYDAFILSDVSAEDLNDSFLNNLEAAVKLQGKGLLVTGGENSYAVGGYYKTPLETILPVNMDITPKEEVPNLGLVLVIDKSGSMGAGQYGISKMELAKEAAIRATEVLTENDSIGIIAFDSAVKWVAELQRVKDLEKIQDAIGTIRPDGGTSILPPLEEAYRALSEADTKLKHVILLTDGQAEKSGYEPVIEGMRNAGITLSTVAVGLEADAELLQMLADWGNGRFYMTDEFSDIPKIFAKETFLAAKAYLNNRTFTPGLKNWSEILEGIDFIPSLDGYVGTTAKNTAKVILQSDIGDPILAAWQYGLGRTVAWTSDSKGVWTSGWLKWEGSPRFWNNIVSWISQKRLLEDYSVQGRLENGKGVIELTLSQVENPENMVIDAVMTSPSGIEEEIRLNAVSPVLYSGIFNTHETGVYIANITVKDGNDEIKSLSSGIAIPYSPEYNIVREDSNNFFEKLAYESGGRIIKSPDEVFSGELPPVAGISDLTPLLIILSMILLMVEVAFRRLGISFGKVRMAVAKARGLLERVIGPFRCEDNIGVREGETGPEGIVHTNPHEKNTGVQNGESSKEITEQPDRLESGIIIQKGKTSHELETRHQKSETNSGVEEGQPETSSNNRGKATHPKKRVKEPEKDNSSIQVLLDKKRKRER
ncbi:MAG TPA: VWA domain-containing protein [Clostridiaceae bacterium]|jgi:uncharacterized membrane protein|nr:VWA domain-containing protein [Clostridiaceae bacterium]